jgi:hypothetical protein
MGLKDNVENLKAVEDRARTIISERTKYISTVMKAPLVPYIKRLVEIGETVLPEDQPWGLRIWIMFLRLYEGPSFGARLIQPELGVQEAFDFTSPHWNRFMLENAETHTFHEDKQNPSEKFERLYLGVNLFWIKDKQIKEMNVHSRVEILHPSGWWDNWDENGILPREIYVDSGEGLCREFPVTWDDRRLPVEEVESVISTAYMRADRAERTSSWDWKLALEKFSWGRPSHLISAWDSVKSKQLDPGKMPGGFVPLPPFPTMAAPAPAPFYDIMSDITQMQTQAKLASVVDELIRTHSLPSSFGSWGWDTK